MGLDSMGVMSARMRWIRLAWLATDLILAGAYSCLLERNNDYVGMQYVLIPLSLPWLFAWIYFIFCRRFGDVLAKTLVLTAGLVWNYECHEGIWRFVAGGAWEHVIGFLTHELVNRLGFSFVWSGISWLIGGLILWGFLRVSQWLTARKTSSHP